METRKTLPVPLQLCTYRFSDHSDAAVLARSLDGMDVHALSPLLADLSYHSLLPLMHLALQDLKDMGLAPSIPAALHTDCAVAFHRDLVRTTLIDHQCQLLLMECAREGILPMPLKGNYLSSKVYTHKEARPYRDIDLMVRASDLPLMDEVLRRSGFRGHRGMVEFLPPPYSTSYVKNLEGDRLKVDLDLHTSIHWPPEYFTRTCFNVADIWSSAVKVDLNGVPAMTMSPEHQVVYTCIDMAINHRFAHLLKFRDLYEVMSRFPLNFEEVTSCAERWEVRSFVYLALHLFRQSGGQRLLPAAFPSRLRPRYPLCNIFRWMVPARSLPSRRARDVSPSNLLFLLLADDIGSRGRGLLTLPHHYFRKLKYPDLH